MNITTKQAQSLKIGGLVLDSKYTRYSVLNVFEWCPLFAGAWRIWVENKTTKETAIVVGTSDGAWNWMVG
jgi:hypothetical protein